ncbi:MAG: M1 family metallopeptidase [Acidimicrobiales bacterium]
MTADSPHRLPRTVTPSHYALRLEPDLSAATFVGSAVIDVEILDDTDLIVVNAAELEIDGVELENDDGTRASAVVELDAETERATFVFPELLAAGHAIVHVSFRGVLNDKLRGFYRSTFTDESGAERVLATTQFESTSARRSFPCWDEPDLKATFDVTLVADADLLAVSCMGETGRRILDDGRAETTFATTPLLSTYLLAWVVGPLEVTAPVDVDGIPLRVVHPPGKAHLTGFALDAGAFALRWLTEYFDIVYPGDKIDLLAIPDFAFGAMENFGCVTFRERLLLVDPDVATQPEQERAVDVIAHELAHMWFGDLVTMRWWNGVWLKEAFATFMETSTTDAYRPEWLKWVTFGHDRAAAFDVDALTTTRAIEFEVGSPAEAEGMYDILTYEKGASVVRMLEQYLGAGRFRTGIRHYLTKHSYGNTENTDLWDALEETTGEPVRRIMDNWIFQGGHPVISLSRPDASTVSLSQRRFLYRGTDETRWPVPVTMTVGRGAARETVRVLLEDDTTVDVGDADWVVGNRQGDGFYRVAYDDTAYTALLGALADLHPLERYGLVDDGWASVVAGDREATWFCDLVGSFAAEDDVSVWQRLTGGLGAIHHVAPDEALPGFSRRVRELVGPALERIGRSGAADDSARRHELRASLIRTLGTVGADGTLVEWAVGAVDDPDVHPSLAAAATTIAADHGDLATFERFVQRWRSAPTPQEENRFLFSLGLFGDPAAFDRALTMATDGTVRTQDAPYLLGRMLGHRELGEVAWRHVVAHWDTITTAFPDNSIPRMLEGIRSLSAPDLAAEVDAFVESHPVSSGALTVAQHREKLAINVELRRRETPRLIAAFG